MTKPIRKATITTVRVGPFTAFGDGITPETSALLSSADEAYALKANGGEVMDISGLTWTGVSGVPGWFDLTLGTSETNVVGDLDIVVQDVDLFVPVFSSFNVLEAAVFDKLFAAGASLNDVSTSQLNAAIEAYDPPTRTEATADKAEIIAATPGTSDVANGVWDALLSDHVISGSAGAGLAAAGAGGDPWATIIPGSYNPGEAGYFLGNLNDFDPAIQPVDIGTIGMDTSSMENLRDQFNGVGIGGPSFPATQEGLGNIAVAGAAINTIAESYVLTTGTQSANTFAATAALDGTRHEHTDTAGAMDLYYQFDVGGDGVPTSAKVTGYLNGTNDTLGVYAYNWVGTSWDQVGSLAGNNGSANETDTYDLLLAHVGTGSDLGKVRVRFYAASGLTSATLRIDQLVTSYAIVNRTVGYANGSVWLDTTHGVAGTEPYVNGTADNASDTLANALTIMNALNLHRLTMSNESSVTFTVDTANLWISGDEADIALGGQSIASTLIFGANLSGVATGEDYRLESCRLGTVSLDPGGIGRCAITTGITATATGTYLLEGCFSGVAGTGTPYFDFNGVGNVALNMRHYSGGIEIRNMNAGDTMSLEGTGQLVIAASCSGGTVAIRGAFTVTDNASGAVTLSDNARIDRAQVQASATASLVAYDGPTYAELTSEINAVQADIAALENLSQAQAATAALSALTTYDGPTRVEATADKDEILNIIGTPIGPDLVDDIQVNFNILALLDTSEIRAQADAALAAYDGPTRTEATADKDAILTQGNSAWATATGFATSEIAAEMNTRFDLVDAEIAALENLSQAQAEAAADAALATYDGPTYAELVAEINAVQSDIAGLNDIGTSDLNTALQDYGVATATDVAAVTTVINSLNDVSTADLAAAIETALTTTSRVELTAVPDKDADLVEKINWLFAVAVGKLTNDGTTQTVYDAAGAALGTSAVTDLGGITTRERYL